jgi:hypothetical protein
LQTQVSNQAAVDQTGNQAGADSRVPSSSDGGQTEPEKNAVNVDVIR